MNDAGKYARIMLEKLIENNDGGREKRSGTEFLPFPGEWPGEAEGDLWGLGWQFYVPRSMADALDIVLTTFSHTENVLDEKGKPIPLTDEQGYPVKKNGKTQYKKQTFYESKWTQGSAFRFSEGMVFYDTVIPPKEKWEVSLQRINQAVRILEAQPAEPAKGDTARNPGRVRYRRYYPNSERTKLEPAKDEVTITQDDFLALLIGE